MLATVISALSRRYGISRKKIQEHPRTWLNFDLSVGLICKSIREAGIACYPIVDELIDDLQIEVPCKGLAPPPIALTWRFYLGEVNRYPMLMLSISGFLTLKSVP